MEAILDLQLEQFEQFFMYVIDTSYQVKKKKLKTDFQDGHHGGHLGFLIGTISPIFDLQVTPMLPIVSTQLAF